MAFRAGRGTGMVGVTSALSQANRRRRVQTSANQAWGLPDDLSVAVLIPCYNEAAAIAKVVADFRAVLPWARIYVYDNNSNDGTVVAARDAGAVVRTEALQGKGHVVRRMFADVEADVFVLVDGDDTYDAAVAPEIGSWIW
jgi:glycosyltransferase involved in cell wall biosynthesis